MEVSYKVKHVLIIQSSNCTSRETNVYVYKTNKQKNNYIQIFIASLLIMVNKQTNKQKLEITQIYFNKPNVVHPYHGIALSKSMKYATMWANMKGVILSKKANLNGYLLHNSIS